MHAQWRACVQPACGPPAPPSTHAAATLSNKNNPQTLGQSPAHLKLPLAQHKHPGLGTDSLTLLNRVTPSKPQSLRALSDRAPIRGNKLSAQLAEANDAPGGTPRSSPRSRRCRCGRRRSQSELPIDPRDLGLGINPRVISTLVKFVYHASHTSRNCATSRHRPPPTLQHSNPSVTDSPTYCSTYCARLVEPMHLTQLSFVGSRPGILVPSIVDRRVHAYSGIE
ncbi:hypothetical protein BDW22DRAFT_939893 [Trametopsis cervina]|nr:hypothetical protein BDW22DRAFT_939893 [Trametopsis cervina]